MVAGAIGPAYATTSDAARRPATSGRNRKSSVHAAPAARPKPGAQLPVTRKSPGLLPSSVTAVSVNVPEPLLMAVIVCTALLLPTSIAPNASDVALTVRNGSAGATPVPVSAMAALPPFDAMARLALRAPIAAGVNWYVTVQLCDADSIVPFAQPPVRAKSAGLAPPSVKVAKVSVPPPVFVTLKVCAALELPCVTLPNANDAALAASTGVVALESANR